MSMSTFISDLPGSQEEVLYEDNENENNYENNGGNDNDNDSDIENKLLNKNQDIQISRKELTEPIKLSFKKKKRVTDEDNLFRSIKRELNEENILLFILIFVATLTQSNEYIRRGLVSMGGTGFSHMSVTLAKCGVLVLLFVLIKKFFTRV
jgi:hypothetical protein